MWCSGSLMIHFSAPWGEATRWIRLVCERWALGDSFPRSLGLGKARFWPADSVSECCVCSPTKFVGLPTNSPESDQIRRSPTKFSGVRQNSPQSDQIRRTGDKILRSPTKPRDWLAFAAADVLIQGGYREGYWG